MSNRTLWAGALALVIVGATLVLMALLMLVLAVAFGPGPAIVTAAWFVPIIVAFWIRYFNALEKVRG